MRYIRPSSGNACYHLAALDKAVPINKVMFEILKRYKFTSCFRWHEICFLYQMKSEKRAHKRIMRWKRDQDVSRKIRNWKLNDSCWRVDIFAWKYSVVRRFLFRLTATVSANSLFFGPLLNVTDAEGHFVTTVSSNMRAVILELSGKIAFLR